MGNAVKYELTCALCGGSFEMPEHCPGCCGHESPYRTSSTLPSVRSPESSSSLEIPPPPSVPSGMQTLETKVHRRRHYEIRRRLDKIEHRLRSRIGAGILGFSIGVAIGVVFSVVVRLMHLVH